MSRNRAPRGASARVDRRALEREALLTAGTRDHYEDTALYDFEYSDRTDDIRHYRELAAGIGAHTRVLELGAGTGRISIPLARDGHSVIALDAMPPMLESLERTAARVGLTDRIRPLHADMREVPLGDDEVDLVIAPFNALMHLYRWQDLLACFREAQRVLRTGGMFAFDVQIPDLEWLEWDPEVRHAVTRFVHPVTREPLIYSTNHNYDPETQICHIRIYYDDVPPAGRRFVAPAQPRKLVHLAHRQIFPEELRMLVATAGLELESLTGDFDGRALRDGEDSQVAICRKR